MGTEKTREEMIRAAKELRAFYQELGMSEETIERAVKADLDQSPKAEEPPEEPEIRSR
jgi:hypothetical protein